jgi:hypothetical protein
MSSKEESITKHLFAAILFYGSFVAAFLGAAYLAGPPTVEASTTPSIELRQVEALERIARSLESQRRELTELGRIVNAIDKMADRCHR